MNRIALYFITFVANAAVLVFEIAGVRLLAPHMGTSTEVWAGLIAVILGGLAIGYWIGGEMARTNPSTLKLSALLFLAAAAAFLAWLLRNTAPALVLSLFADLSLTSYAVIAGTVLFLPTTVLLGAVSPYSVRLALQDLVSASSVIGNFSALGAVGSILGSIATGMFLIPSFGLSTIILGVVAVLGVLAIVAAGITQRHAVTGALAVGVAVWLASAADPTLASNVIADIDTPYNRVWVSEIQNDTSDLRIRYLKTDPFGLQCAMVIGPEGPREDILVFPYLKAFAVADTLTEPMRTLMIGGCNYSYPRFFLAKHPEARMHVIELDPGMTALAEEWFGLKEEPRLSIEHADARTALAQSEEAYSVIFMDAFNSFSSAPFQLTTKEFFESAYGKLEEGGVLVMNVIGALEGERAQFPAALYRTVREVFPSAAVYTIASSAPEKGQNLVFVATKASKTVFVPHPFAYGESLSLVSQEIHERLYATGLLLTDDHAPVEALSKSVRDAVIAAFVAKD